MAAPSRVRARALAPPTLAALPCREKEGIEKQFRNGSNVMNQSLRFCIACIRGTMYRYTLAVSRTKLVDLTSGS